MNSYPMVSDDNYEYAFVSNSQLVEDIEIVGNQILSLILAKNVEKDNDQINIPKINLGTILMSGHSPGEHLKTFLTDKGCNVTTYANQTSRYGDNKEGGAIEWIRELSPLEQIELVVSMYNHENTFIIDELVQDGTTLDGVEAFFHEIRKHNHRLEIAGRFMRDYERFFNSSNGKTLDETGILRYKTALNNLPLYVQVEECDLQSEIFKGVLHVKQEEYEASGHTVSDLDYFAHVFEPPKSDKPLWVVYEYKSDTWKYLLSTRTEIPPWAQFLFSSG